MKVSGDLVPAMQLLAAWQGSPPELAKPIAGHYVLTAALAMENGLPKLNCTMPITDFAVTDNGKQCSRNASSTLQPR